ncbi:MAG: Nif3-like dinuclear metal center hexameric protein [Rectinemataceae bacterium]|jgi:dinuclear metal center YbgI/SA1388 family protein
MDIKDLDRWCRSILEIDALSKIDDSLNGIQVGRSEGTVELVAFAVDACAESIRRAAAAGAQALFVHHGLFWGRASRVEGGLLARMRLLLDADLALYACHLPLDKHPELGNNAVLARLIGLKDLRGFGEFHGVEIGLRGRLDPPLALDEIVRRVLPDGSRPKTLIPGSKAETASVAVVSGGAAMEAFQAIGSDIDLYVTGESSHSIYHAVLEGGMGFLAAGHYATEVWGVKAVAERLSRETGIKTLFIDLPTGL